MYPHLHFVRMGKVMIGLGITQNIVKRACLQNQKGSHKIVVVFPSSQGPLIRTQNEHQS